MPLLSPPPPPPRPPRRRRRKRRSSKERCWAGLPLDALLYVFHKLDDVELMFGGAARVCRSWRLAARGEPELWRRVDLRGHSRLFWTTISFSRMARLAIWFSAGQCEAFFGEHNVDDDLLLFLAEQAPSLKSLHLIDCDDVHAEAFAAAITRFPLLEELELSACGDISAAELQLVAMACPRLKHLKHAKTARDRYLQYHYHAIRLPRADNGEALAIAAMRELRSLRLDWHDLDGDGLAAILDGCARLDSLELRCCYRVDVYGSSSLRAKCGHVTTKKIHPCPCGLAITLGRIVLGLTCCSRKEFFARHGSDYFQLADSPFGSSVSKFLCTYGGRDEGDCQALYAVCYRGHGAGDDDDDADYVCYFSGVEEAGLKEHDRILGMSRRSGHLRI